MKIYDISQEVFGCEVYPGDPRPEKQILSSTEKGDLYNLSSINMCVHNGTHIDSPYHFINDGKTVDDINLEKFIGYCIVKEHKGILTEKDAIDILALASEKSRKRILIKGDAVVSYEAAKVFAKEEIFLIGNESQTIGPEEAPMKIHIELLSKDIVLLEGIRLGAVPEGEYLLCAQPINLAGCDGAPVRAVLIEF